MEIAPLVALKVDQVYGDSCRLGTHGQLEWCNGEEGKDKEDIWAMIIECHMKQDIYVYISIQASSEKALHWSSV